MLTDRKMPPLRVCRAFGIRSVGIFVYNIKKILKFKEGIAKNFGLWYIIYV